MFFFRLILMFRRNTYIPSSIPPASGWSCKGHEGVKDDAVIRQAWKEKQHFSLWTSSSRMLCSMVPRVLTSLVNLAFATPWHAIACSIVCWGVAKAKCTRLVYQRIWNLEVGEVAVAVRDVGNGHDCYAVAEASGFRCMWRSSRP